MRVAAAVTVALAASGGACQLVSGVGSLEIDPTLGSGGTSSVTTSADGGGGAGGATTSAGGAGGATTSAGGASGHGGASSDGGAAGHGGATTTTSTCTSTTTGTCDQGRAWCAASAACADLATASTNCGGCAVDCGGAACNVGVCVPAVVAEGEGNVQHLALGGGYLLWATGNGDAANSNKLRARSLPSGPPFDVTKLVGFVPHVVATDGTFAYVGSFDPEHYVLRVELAKNASGAPQQNPNDSGGQPGIRAMALDGTDLYVTTWLQGTSSSKSGVRRISTASVSATKEVATGFQEAFGLVVDPEANGSVYFTAWDPSLPAGVLEKVPKQGGDAVLVANGNFGGQGERFYAVAAIGDALYVGTDSRILRVPRGGAVTSTVTSTSGPVQVLAAAGTWLYYSDGGAAYRVNVGCGSDSPETVVEGQEIGGFVADATTMYFTQHADLPVGGAVYRTAYAPKP